MKQNSRVGWTDSVHEINTAELDALILFMKQNSRVGCIDSVHETNTAELDALILFMKQIQQSWMH